MTELAYMTYTDWSRGVAEHGTRIREWLDGEPFVFLDPTAGRNGAQRPLDPAVLGSIVPAGAQQVVAPLSELREFTGAGEKVFDHGVVVMYPFEERECEFLREVIVSGRVKRIFVMVWSATYLVADMLDGLEAVNLFTQEKVDALDPLQRAAAAAMVSEQYNGLESGRGKDAVIQLLRAMQDEGYLLDERWIHAIFAEGGTYRSAETVGKFIREMNKGVRHRVQQRFVPDIVRVLRTQIRDAKDTVAAG